jgi:hypothetical protein
MQIIRGKAKEVLHVDLNHRSQVGQEVRIKVTYFDPDPFQAKAFKVVLDLRQAEELVKILNICIEEGKIRACQEEDEDD